jgi:hypothetical protein
VDRGTQSKRNNGEKIKQTLLYKIRHCKLWITFWNLLYGQIKGVQLRRTKSLSLYFEYKHLES